MKTYYGIVEDRQDPLKIGRVRVRVHQIHSSNKMHLSTPDLPWAQVMLPTTSAGLSGFGTQHGLVEGSTVVLFFKDEESCQQPVIIGSVAGIPQVGYREGFKDELINRKADDGFNDPRKLTATVKDKDGNDISSYYGTPDGPNPGHAPTRGFGLTTALDTAPQVLYMRNITMGLKPLLFNETLQKSLLPLYPRYTEESDVSSWARGDGDYTHRDIDTTIKTKILIRDTNSKTGFETVMMSELGESKKTGKLKIKSPAKPVYPYNKALFTESGHLLEVDDTLGAERIAVEHRTGTFQEMHPDGSMVTRVVNTNYTVVCKDDEVVIGGKVTVNIGGDATMSIGGNLKADVSGTTDITSGKNLTIVAPEIGLHGTVVKLNS
jgi:hypothetical protein